MSSECHFITLYNSTLKVHILVFCAPVLQRQLRKMWGSNKICQYIFSFNLRQKTLSLGIHVKLNIYYSDKRNLHDLYLFLRKSIERLASESFHQMKVKVSIWNYHSKFLRKFSRATLLFLTYIPVPFFSWDFHYFYWFTHAFYLSFS